MIFPNQWNLSFCFVWFWCLHLLYEFVSKKICLLSKIIKFTWFFKQRKILVFESLGLTFWFLNSWFLLGVKIILFEVYIGWRVAIYSLGIESWKFWELQSFVYSKESKGPKKNIGKKILEHNFCEWVIMGGEEFKA